MTAEMRYGKSTKQISSLKRNSRSNIGIPGTLGPLAVEEAYADHRGNSQDNEQSARAIQNAAGVVVAQVAVPANVDVDVTDVNACIIVSDCD